jgi:geranylgeranyl diphosphate synthase type II
MPENDNTKILLDFFKKTRETFNRNLKENWLPFIRNTIRHGEFSINEKSSQIKCVQEFYDIINYSIDAPGKRFRPFLVKLGSMLFDAKKGKEFFENIFYLQLAYECMHTYSLIHDDLPLMDNDDFRRGRETVHKKFSETDALLAGDSLNSMSFYCLSFLENVQLDELKVQLCLLHNASNYSGMIMGQFADLKAEKMFPNNDFSLSDIEFIHFRKTGAMIAASFLSGFLSGLFHLTGEEIIKSFQSLRNDTQKKTSPLINRIVFHEKYGGIINILHQWNFMLGLLFQIKDDLMDLQSNRVEMGKDAGKDTNKLTYVTLLGEDGAIKRMNHLHNELMSRLRSLKKILRDSIPLIIDENIWNILNALACYVVTRKK